MYCTVRRLAPFLRLQCSCTPREFCVTCSLKTRNCSGSLRSSGSLYRAPHTRRSGFKVCKGARPNGERERLLRWTSEGGVPPPILWRNSFRVREEKKEEGRNEQVFVIFFVCFSRKRRKLRSIWPQPSGNSTLRSHGKSDRCQTEVCNTLTRGRVHRMRSNALN